MRLDSVQHLKQSLRNTEAHGINVGAAVAFFKSGADPASSQPFGVALGIASGIGKADYRLAVRLNRFDATTKVYLDMVSLQARGEVDIQLVGDIQAIRPLPATAVAPSLRAVNRPLIPGCSIGHVGITAGTLGGFVKLADGSIRILSNNHVLANADAGRVGDKILQPGPIDGGTDPRDIVAYLQEFAPLRSNIDAALAKMESNIAFDALYQGAPLTGVEEASLDLQVCKLGRTTGFTKGKITAISVDDVPVRYGRMVVYFDNQMEIEGNAGIFSQGGDSGSLIFDEQHKAVGLLFAGTTSGGSSNMGVTYANVLSEVLRYFQAELWV